VKGGPKRCGAIYKGDEVQEALRLRVGYWY